MKYLVSTEVMVRYTYHIDADSLESAEAEAMHKTYDDADKPFHAESSTSVNDVFMVRCGVLCKECETSYNPNETAGDTCTNCKEVWGL